MSAEVCNNCKDYLNNELSCDDWGAEKEMAKRHLVRILMHQKRSDCDDCKLCIPQLETELWRQRSDKRKSL